MDESLKNYDGPDRVVSSTTFAAMHKAAPIPTHKTGLTLLDETIEGFEPGEIIVVCGPSAMGKTTLCQTITKNLNVRGQRSLFFTFEVTPMKLLANHTAPEETIYLPLQHKAMDLAWLRDRTREAIEKYGITAVFIDHLHYVIDMTSHFNMSLEIGKTMRYIKRDIALDLNIPVFLVAHMVKVPLDQEPAMHHLRDSALIACEADTVLVVYRRLDIDLGGKSMNSMVQGLATVKVDKARRSGAMGVKISVKKEGSRLVESLEPEEDSHASQRTKARASRDDKRYGAD